ncbi:MAG: sigma factor-like helix-turn-helix DNA-binding protein [Streptosporangiaceae bacterium]
MNISDIPSLIGFRRSADCAIDLDALLAAACLGSEQAFAGIYDALADRAYRLAFLLTTDAAAAGQVTEQTFGDLWHALGNSTPPRHGAGVWATEFLDQHILKNTRNQPFTGALGPSVLHALRALTETERSCIALAFDGARTTGQTARLLGIRESHVHTSIHHGLSAMAGPPTTG